MWEPIHFRPVYQSYIWGGRQLVDLFQRTDAPSECPVAESWEVSDRAEGMSVVSGGAFDGLTLYRLLAEHAQAVLGTAVGSPVFPLLIKLLDANQALSVQVHPDDESAAKGLGEAKSEAWYVLDAKPGACVYRGFHPWVTLEHFDQAVRDGTVVDLLIRCSVTSGDMIYIPGGTVHAIGAGCLLLEVQQNSNTTYRVFDWNRKDTTGKSRELNIEQAKKVIHFNSDESHSPAEDGRCITPFFSIEPVNLGKRPLSLSDPLKGYTIIFVEEGAVSLQYPGGACIAGCGTTWLIPAALKNCKAARHESDSARIVLIRGVRAL